MVLGGIIFPTNYDAYIRQRWRMNAVEKQIIPTRYMVMIRLLDEVCGQILFEILIFAIIAILVNAGMSESEAEFTVLITAVIFLCIILTRLQIKRKALGKAVELDTDGDGRISEEEWAAAGMANDNEEVRGAENDWWGQDDQEE